MEQPQSTAPLDNTRKSGQSYPEPIVVLPSTTHTHTLILLHGRGSNAALFQLELLSSKTSSGKTLQELFPSVKFIFPTAKGRRSVLFKRLRINQWFDIYSLVDPAERKDLQYEGLKESTEFISTIVRKEGSSLPEGVGNVIIGGLSQGCAMALIISLSFAWTRSAVESEGSATGKLQSGEASRKSLGGFIGMSGWLPFAQDIGTAAVPPRHFEHDNDDPFMTDIPESTNEPAVAEAQAEDSPYIRQLRASNHVRDLVDLPPLELNLDHKVVGVNAHHSHLCSTPYFLGHGMVDETVSFNHGLQARDILSQLGLDVSWKPYADQGHWYKVPEELDDIASFLREKIGIS